MKQSGFTLLEVLVAMVVLSIGLLGLAGLMAASMRNNESAYHSTQATWLAYDMLDRIRANRAGARSGDYNGVTLGAPATCATAVATGSVSAQDIGNWKNALACALPAGDGAIEVITAPGASQDRIRVTVQWNDSRATSGSTSRQLVVESQL